MRMTVQTADPPEKAASTALKAETPAAVVLSRTVVKAAEARPGAEKKEAASAVLSATVTSGAVTAEVQTVRLSEPAETIIVRPVAVTAAKVVSKNQAVFPQTATTVGSTVVAMTAEKEPATVKAMAITRAVSAAKEALTVMSAAVMLRAKTGHFLEIVTKTVQSAQPAGKAIGRLTAVLHVKTAAAMTVLHLSRNGMTVRSGVHQGQIVQIGQPAGQTVQIEKTVRPEPTAKVSKKAASGALMRKPRKLLSTT